MKYRTLPFFVCAALAANSTVSLGADLLSVYRDAIAQDPVYAAARATYEAVKENVPQAKAATLPAASVSGSTNTILNDTRTAFGGSSRNYPTLGATLSGSYPLYRPANWIALDQAGLQVVQAEAVFADVRQNVASRVSQAYFDVLLSQDNVELSAAQKKAFAEQLAAAKRNFEVGTATIVDTYEAQARYDLAISKEIADKNDLEVKKSALQQIIGKAAPVLAGLKESATLTPPSPANVEEWVKRAEDASPTIAQLRAALEIAKKDIDRNKAGEKPTVDVLASHAYNNAPSTGSTFVTNNSALGLSVNFPLYTGGATQSRIRQAVQIRERALQDLENAKRVVAQNVRSSFLTVTSGAAQVKALEASLVSSKASLDSTLLGKEVGVRTNVDVLNAQQQLFQTRRDLQQARYNTVLAQLRLKAASGQLGEEDLAAVNRLLSN